MNTKHILYISTVIGVIVIGGVGVGLKTNVIKLPYTKIVEVQFIPGLEDDRIMMGAAHNVFVGKIVKQVSTIDTGIGPSTQFEVEVIYNIKGNLNGIVIVDQQVGYENGILYSVEGDSLLQAGSTYILTTRYFDQKSWYTVSAHANGRKLISTDTNLNKSQLQELAKKDLRVQQLQEAYKKEILLDADIKNNNTRNSYQFTNNGK